MSIHKGQQCNLVQNYDAGATPCILYLDRALLWQLGILLSPCTTACRHLKHCGQDDYFVFLCAVVVFVFMPRYIWCGLQRKKQEIWSVGCPEKDSFGVRRGRGSFHCNQRNLSVKGATAPKYCMVSQKDLSQIDTL